MDTIFVIMSIVILITVILTVLIKANSKTEQKRNRSTLSAHSLLSSYGFNIDKIESTNLDSKNMIAIDEINQKIAFLSKNLLNEEFKVSIIEFKDIIETKIVTENQNIIKTSKGMVLAGGIVGGGIGAMVGGLVSDKSVYSKITSGYLEIVTNNLSKPCVSIPFITEWEGTAYANSDKLKFAKERLDYWFKVTMVVNYRNKKLM